MEQRVRQKVGKRKVMSQEPEAHRAWEMAEMGQVVKGRCPKGPLDPESQQRWKSGLEQRTRPQKKKKKKIGKELFINLFYI